MLWSLQEKGRHPAGHSHRGGRTCRPGGPESSRAFPRPHGDRSLFCPSLALPACLTLLLGPLLSRSLQASVVPALKPCPISSFPFASLRSFVLCQGRLPAGSPQTPPPTRTPLEFHTCVSGITSQSCKLDLEGTVSHLPQTSSAPRSPCSLGCAPLLPASYRP